MQNDPVVAIPVADDRQRKGIHALNQIWGGFRCSRMEAQAFRTAPQTQEACAGCRGSHRIAHMAESKIGSVADGHGGNASRSAIFFIKLPYTRVGRALS